MKRVFTIAVALLMCATMFAKPVSRETARQVAVNFWNTTDRGIATAVAPDFLEISTELGLSGFYVFNTPQNDGCVLVSADDVMTPILGYSTFNGMVGRTSMPANLKWWLGHYTEEFEAVQTLGLTADQETADEWIALIDGTYSPKGNGAKAVSALIQTKWDQDEPYSNLCPQYNSSTHCATGCVATAMAQVMKYWEWPTTGTGSHSYTSETNNYSCNVNFGSTTYQWSNMLAGGYSGYTYLPNSWTTDQKTAVATLMYHCGVSVDMDYDYESGAYAEDVPSALTTYFGYAPGARIVYKDNYSNNDWIAILKAELDASRPMLYGGQSSAGGHSFICDGYDANNKFHFNFGWSGSGDNFYALTSINPGSGGTGGGSYNFTSNQDAIIGISSPNGNPVDPASIPPEVATYQTFTINSPVTYGSNITGECDFVIYGSSYNGYLGVAAYLNGQFVAILKQVGRSTWNQYTGPDLTISCPATAPFGNGTYTAKAVFSSDGQNWYPLEVGYYGAPVAVEFTITGAPATTTYTITAVPNDANMGTVSGGGSYAAGTTVTLTASPKSGYQFVRWNDNLTSSQRTITVTGNATYTAYFEANGGSNSIDDVTTHDVKLYPNPTNGVLNVEMDGLKKVEVIDAVGRVVISQTNGNAVDMSRLDNGIYTVRITTEAGAIVRKVAKQ